jgi:hypothetical protein
MPAKMMMTLSNGNLTHKQVASYTAFMKTKEASKPKPNGSLTASMIGRIHDVKPGCGSCGK